jgi:cysteine-rich repeat protein
VGSRAGSPRSTRGSATTCALTSGGGVKCWGDNGAGELGDGTTTDRHTAVDASGLTSGVAAIAAGNAYTCALTTDGGVRCWGYNGSGQLGDGTTTNRYTAVDVSGLTSGVAAVAAGVYHACALTTAGGVKCWGDNYYGQLGDGTRVDRHTAVDVSGLTSGVVAIDAGWFYTCALTAGGGVKCWGNNGYAQLGDGTAVDRPTPVDVSGLTSGVTAIAAGVVHACALTTSGGAKCWGDNGNGELGDGEAGNYLEPRAIAGFGPDCGNGIFDDGEECDDGNVASGDGCSSTCATEVCGNGILDPEEACDDGNLVADDGCTPTCVAQPCGNGILDSGEMCDDGNIFGGDGCSATCVAEACGNGTLDFGEMCDDGNVVAGDGCSPNCVAEVCGNGILDPGETCDDGNVVAGDGCSPTCAAEPMQPCSAAPVSGCVYAAQAQLQIVEKTAGKAKLALQWKRLGIATTPDTFGDPVQGTTGVEFCLYSDTNTLVQGYVIDRARQSCSGTPCWARKGTSYAYADRTASADGITKIRVRAGDAGTGQASARGANNDAKGQLELPTGVAAALVSEQHPTMQLVTSDGRCVTATLSEVLKADGTTYKGRKK